MKPIPKLCALVAYYPRTVPKTSAGFPTSHNVAVHLAGPPSNTPNCHLYSYPGVEAGFAEENLEQYDKISASLAWSRTLSILRKGFDIEVDLEKIWDDHVACESLCLEKFDSRSPMASGQWNLSPKMQTRQCRQWSINHTSITFPP